MSSFSLTTFESLFDLGDSGRTFSTLQQSHRDAIAALSGQVRADAYNELPTDAHGPAIDT